MGYLQRRIWVHGLLIVGALVGFCMAFAGLLAGSVLGIEDMESGAILTFVQQDSFRGFPHRIGQTSLIARQLVVYEGPYLETGADTPVSEITALLLYNDGPSEISQAEVRLTGEEELWFYASNIPPRSQVLVLERNIAPWKEWQITACEGWSSLGQPGLPDGALDIQEVDMGTLAVTNTTEQPLEEVWLFYKNYLPQSQLYVGGITYITVIEKLEPGQTLQIKPERYASGYSRIIRAEQIP